MWKKPKADITKSFFKAKIKIFFFNDDFRVEVVTFEIIFDKCDFDFLFEIARSTKIVIFGASKIIPSEIKCSNWIKCLAQ